MPSFLSRRFIILHLGIILSLSFHIFNHVADVSSHIFHISVKHDEYIHQVPLMNTASSSSDGILLASESRTLLPSNSRRSSSLLVEDATDEDPQKQEPIQRIGINNISVTNNTTTNNNSHQKLIILTYAFGEKTAEKGAFRLFIESCRNAGIDFAIIGDVQLPYELPDNFQHFHISWDGFVDLIFQKIRDGNETTKLRKAGFRKMCDFTPLMGYLFPEVVNGYDWWGHIDR